MDDEPLPMAPGPVLWVRDMSTAGLDRALEVVWGLPMALGGAEGQNCQGAGVTLPPPLSGSRAPLLPCSPAQWYWWDDMRHSRPITTGIAVADPPPEYPLPSGLSWVYEHVVSGVWDGWLPISLYPYALIGDGTHGLALAVSLDSPRLVKLAYDQEQERFEARGYLGISPLATRVAGQADLSLELYRVDPTWGFRAAMDRFAARHPDWFESPRSMYDYTGYDRAHYGSEVGARQVLTYDLEGVFTSQTTGLIKGITNVFRLLNRLEVQELSIDYPPNNRLNLIATADENADRVAVLGWYHVNIKPYETNGTVQYDELLAGLEADGIGPVTTTLSFENLTPGATYTQTVYVVDQTHSNAFPYRHAVLDDLTANCGANPDAWERTCVYRRMDEINTWTLDTTNGAASVALEVTTTTLTADDQGRAEVTITLEPYSVWLVVLER